MEVPYGAGRCPIETICPGVVSAPLNSEHQHATAVHQCPARGVLVTRHWDGVDVALVDGGSYQVQSILGGLHLKTGAP
jgi:hypothetical protein